MNTTRTQ